MCDNEDRPTVDQGEKRAQRKTGVVCTRTAVSPSLHRNAFEELTRDDIVDSLVVASFVHGLPIARQSCDNHMALARIAVGSSTPGPQLIPQLAPVFVAAAVAFRRHPRPLTQQHHSPFVHSPFALLSHTTPTIQSERASLSYPIGNPTDLRMAPLRRVESTSDCVIRMLFALESGPSRTVRF